MKAFIRSLLKSLGLKRKLSNLFQLLAVLTTTVPALAPFTAALQGIASWLGVAGVTHSVKAGTFKLDIHTVGAFFSALLLAAKDVPQLQPYVGIITAVSAILSSLASVAFFTE